MGEYTTTVVARNVFPPGIEELNGKKCKKKEEITKPQTGDGKKEGQEKEVKNYVNHNLAEYVLDAVKNAPRIGSIFNLRYLSDEEKKQNEKVQT